MKLGQAQIFFFPTPKHWHPREEAPRLIERSTLFFLSSLHTHLLILSLYLYISPTCQCCLSSTLTQNKKIGTFANRNMPMMCQQIFPSLPQSHQKYKKTDKKVRGSNCRGNYALSIQFECKWFRLNFLLVTEARNKARFIAVSFRSFARGH